MVTQREHTAQTAAVAHALAATLYVGKPTIPAGMTIADYRKHRNEERNR